MLPGLKQLLESWFSDNAYQIIPGLTVLFCPALYNWILLAAFFVFLYQRKNKEIIISSFLIGLNLTTLLGPGDVVRYYYPIMVSIPVIMTWVFHKSKNGL